MQIIHTCTLHAKIQILNNQDSLNLAIDIAHVLKCPDHGFTEAMHPSITCALGAFTNSRIERLQGCIN